MYLSLFNKFQITAAQSIIKSLFPYSFQRLTRTMEHQKEITHVAMMAVCLHQIGSCIGLPVLVVLIPTIRHCPESMVQGQLGVPGWVEHDGTQDVANETKTSLEKLKQCVLNCKFLMISKFQHLNVLGDRR